MPPFNLSQIAAKLTELQSQNEALQEKVRSLETSYVIDRRVIVIVGSAFALLLVAFSGFSLSQMPEKVVAKLEEDVRSRTGKTIDERVKSVDQSLSQAQGKVAELQASLAAFNELKTQVNTLSVETSKAIKGLQKASTTRISSGEGHDISLDYEENGYALTKGSLFECNDNEWVTSVEIYTNKEAKFSGLTIGCQSAWTQAR